MSDRNLTMDQTVTKEANLVVPLDSPRSADNVTCTILSGISGQIYTIGSGKEAYLKQMFVTELSGHDNCIVQLKDKALSGVTPHIHIPASTVVSVDPRPWQIGPVVSGFSIDHYNTVCGDLTLVLQIDPMRTE